MAELSIVGLVLGSLGFLHTVRNAIEGLLCDVDTLRTQGELLVPLLGRLDLVSIRLETWQTFWHIHKRTPQDIYSSYWGEAGSNRIKGLLSHAHDQLMKIKLEFSSRYGHLLRRDLQSGKNRTFDSFTRHVRRGKRFLRGLNTALFKGSIFDQHLGNLERSVTLLEDLSQAHFVKHVSLWREPNWEEHVEKYAAETSLVYLAKESSAISQAVKELADSLEDYKIDYCLDHGVSPIQRRQKIIEFAEKGLQSYELCVSPRSSVLSLPTLGLRCVGARKPSSPDTIREQSLQHTLQTLLYSENSVGAHIKLKENAPGLILGKSQLPRQEVVESLRGFMVTSKSSEGLSRSEKTRLAYELAECALLSLKTEWFSGLCSCSIYRLEDTDLKTMFVARLTKLSHTDHIDPELGYSCKHLTQWCEEELQSMHIRRLGVLLTEIAIGNPIQQVAFNEESNEIEIDFDIVEDGVGDTREVRFHDILRNVRRQSSEDLKDVVGYCLKQGITPEDTDNAHVMSFLHHVVGPLLRHYDNEIVKPARRRQYRKSTEVSGQRAQNM